MSNGEESTDPADEEAGGTATDADIDVDALGERLDEGEAALADAQSEDDLDAVATTLDDVASALPEDPGEDTDAAELADRLADLRDRLEDHRGPTREDVAVVIDEAHDTLAEAEWTETGRPDALAAVESFLSEADERVAADLETSTGDIAGATAALESAATTIREADLDPDADSESIEALLGAAEALASAIEGAETWDDLSVRETLAAEGFYDRLTPENRKDFPPELSVIRIAEAENDVDRILQALESFESNFMEENVLDALARLGPPEAVEVMLDRAEKRDQDAIRVLGAIGDDRAVETLVEFIGDESNPPLQKATLQALGRIGSEEATQAVANRLEAEDREVRSHAARALGLIGDTRAIAPLRDRLESADEADAVRAAAAWALVQIGTEPALEAAAAHADDRAYLVQTEAEKARLATS